MLYLYLFTEYFSGLYLASTTLAAISDLMVILCLTDNREGFRARSHQAGHDDDLQGRESRWLNYGPSSIILKWCRTYVRMGRPREQ